MSAELKQNLISAGNTFLATFVGVVATGLASGDIQWTGAFWASLGLVALRAGLKAVTARFVPIALGGKK